MKETDTPSELNYQELPKRWKTKIIILSVVSVLFLILIVVFNLFLRSYRAENEKQRTKLVKNDSELIGERIEIQRDGKAGVKANLYVPDYNSDERLPVVFNIHGGGFVGGDADVLDTLGERELPKEFAVLKQGGSLVSLRGLPNGEFAARSGMSFIKSMIFWTEGLNIMKMVMS